MVGDDPHRPAGHAAEAGHELGRPRVPGHSSRKSLVVAATALVTTSRDVVGSVVPGGDDRPGSGTLRPAGRSDSSRTGPAPSVWAGRYEATAREPQRCVGCISAESPLATRGGRRPAQRLTGPTCDPGELGHHGRPRRRPCASRVMAPTSRQSPSMSAGPETTGPVTAPRAGTITGRPAPSPARRTCPIRATHRCPSVTSSGHGEPLENQRAHAARARSELPLARLSPSLPAERTSPPVRAVRAATRCARRLLAIDGSDRNGAGDPSPHADGGDRQSCSAGISRVPGIPSLGRTIGALFAVSRQRSASSSRSPSARRMQRRRGSPGARSRPSLASTRDPGGLGRAAWPPDYWSGHRHKRDSRPSNSRSTKARPPVLENFGQVGLQPGSVVAGEVRDHAMIVEALQRLWREGDFSERRVAWCCWAAGDHPRGRHAAPAAERELDLR